MKMTRCGHEDNYIRSYIQGVTVKHSEIPINSNVFRISLLCVSLQCKQNFNSLYICSFFEDYFFK